MEKYNFNILKKEEINRYKKQIFQMLVECDEEFLPPLSSRIITSPEFLNIKNEPKGIPIDYFNDIINQKIIVVMEEEKVIAFMSFKENYINTYISEETLPNVYVTTLLVKPEYRGKGIAKRIYYMLINECQNVNIYTRTWSTNESHKKILSEIGFKNYIVLQDDRGKGIDTIYFVKEKNNSY